MRATTLPTTRMALWLQSAQWSPPKVRVPPCRPCLPHCPLSALRSLISSHLIFSPLLSSPVLSSPLPSPDKDHEGGGKKRSSSSLGADAKGDGEKHGKSSSSSKSGGGSSKPRSHAPKSKSAPKPKSHAAVGETAHDADDEAETAQDGDDEAGGEHKSGKSTSASSKRSKEAATEDGGDRSDASGDSAPAPPATVKKRKPKVHDDDEKNGDGETKDGQVSTPRYQSNRAAAMVAKTKLNSRGPKSPIEEEAFNQTLPAGGGSSSKGGKPGSAPAYNGWRATVAASGEVCHTTWTRMRSRSSGTAA